MTPHADITIPDSFNELHVKVSHEQSSTTRIGGTFRIIKNELPTDNTRTYDCGAVFSSNASSSTGYRIEIENAKTLKYVACRVNGVEQSDALMQAWYR